MIINGTETIVRRGPLSRTLRAIAGGRLTVGFIGGSITDARVEHNWPEFVTRWLVDRLPGVRIAVENAAIGGTGSDLGLFRARRDLIDRSCDLIFVEYAVNDNPVPPSLRAKSQEGLIRKLLGQGQADVVLVYTYMREMFDEMRQGRVPAVIAGLEALAEHYDLSSVWAGRHVFNLFQRGLVRYDQWLPDGLHPTEYGSSLYADAVISFLNAQLCASAMETAYTLPPPLDEENWEQASLADLSQAEFTGPWVVYRSHSLVWADQIYAATAPGSRVRVTFTGRGAYLITNFGQMSADYRFRVDGGPFQPSSQDFPDWCSGIGWMRAQMLAYPLGGGSHVLEIETLPPGKDGPSAMRMDLIGIGIVP